MNFPNPPPFLWTPPPPPHHCVTEMLTSEVSLSKWPSKPKTSGLWPQSHGYMQSGIHHKWLHQLWIYCYAPLLHVIAIPRCVPVCVFLLCLVNEINSREWNFYWRPTIMQLLMYMGDLRNSAKSSFCDEEGNRFIYIAQSDWRECYLPIYYVYMISLVYFTWYPCFCLPIVKVFFLCCKIPPHMHFIFPAENVFQQYLIAKRNFFKLIKTRLFRLP